MMIDSKQITVKDLAESGLAVSLVEAQPDASGAEKQTEEIAKYIMQYFPQEIGDEGCASVAIRIMERQRVADPAAQSRAALEQARVDGVIQCYQTWAPCPPESPGWRIYFYPSDKKGHNHCSEGATEAEALAAAAAHAESLRKPVVEGMSITQIAEEMKSYGFSCVAVPVWAPKLRWHNMTTGFDGCSQADDEEPLAFHRRALRVEREARAAQ